MTSCNFPSQLRGKLRGFAAQLLVPPLDGSIVDGHGCGSSRTRRTKTSRPAFGLLGVQSAIRSSYALTLLRGMGHPGDGGALCICWRGWPGLTGEPHTVPKGWSEEEERLFLEAIELYGRDWNA